MKIEKVNDNQIRCTLTKADLADRQLKLSELAYGTEKAKDLFRDMMQQAAFEFGFEAENIPLMIEAIPIGTDSIILIITKVEDPEEIDTRFSKFAPSVSAGDSDEDFSAMASDLADDVLDLFHKMEASAKKHSKSAAKSDREPAFPRLVSTQNLEDLCTLSRNIADFYTEPSSLYKNPAAGSYALILTKGDLTTEEFGRICNIASEYGNLEKTEAAKQAFIRDRYETILPDNAVFSLSQI